MENYWKTHGTPIGNSWKIHVKLMKDRIPNVSQPQSAERAERSEASEALQFAYAFRRSEMPPDVKKGSRCSEMPPDAHECIQMFRNASRRSEMHPDVQKDLQMLRVVYTCSELRKLVQTYFVHNCQVFETKRASRSHAKTGS